MTSSAIRRSFLDFFRERQHTLVPSGSLLPDSPNLLFTNAGMNQFVPIFLGKSPPPFQPARAVDTQKCIRAGGKHNDLEDVGFDTYHHTFFEMLGNWSFGDYFKKEAIDWAWELVVGRWNFPPSRLFATVYQPGPGEPAAFDQEAYDLWAAIFRAAGLDPAVHIVFGGKKDNFWMMGETGPCGPCSELHFDLTPGPRTLSRERQAAGRALVNRGQARCIEIWNLVFIQFAAHLDGTFTDLPSRHVDTGLGFERVCSIIQGTKNLTEFSPNGTISNYETDIFRPIFDQLEKLTGFTYRATLPAAPDCLSDLEKQDVAFRVIADHVRALSFAIADGIEPSNEGRGYVLRRILRRAVSYGSKLGLRRPFLAQLVPALGPTMGEVFPEIVRQAPAIQKTLTQEEESFLRTLERGIELFEKSQTPEERARQQPGLVDGSVAFLLSDTYGFPLDLTELLARERGLQVDVPGFERLLLEQKARAKAAQKKDVVELETGAAELRPTTFTGFEELQTASQIESLSGDTLVTVATPFYAAMGGQVGDTGEIEVQRRILPVIDTTQVGGVIVHRLGKPLRAEERASILLRVDAVRRGKIAAHHSATHLLHWALRESLGPAVRQRGSYVGPDRLRFDFAYGAALSSAQITEIETAVNCKVSANVPVNWRERPYAEVKGDASILQYFGDKYGETVRVVEIGDFSRELCGGTHVRESGAVGYLKLLSESAIAAGVRRIEAASGSALIEHVREQLLKQEEVHSILRQRKLDLAGLQAIGGEQSELEFWKLWEQREAVLAQASTDLAQHEKLAAKLQEAAWQKQAALAIEPLLRQARTIGNVPLLTESYAETAGGYLPFLADALKTRWSGVAVFAATQGDKVALLASVSAPFQNKIGAGKLIQAIAPLIQGKGGGRPDLAQGGGTNPDGVLPALRKAEELLL